MSFIQRFTHNCSIFFFKTNEKGGGEKQKIPLRMQTGAKMEQEQTDLKVLNRKDRLFGSLPHTHMATGERQG
ncbi:hypothetical protein EZS27_004056 [termite gut metagenome]|uniref:Uncharacterized protein n=1 Tax=termite gut metagenome TaxID=433724 RepID=A0A5J4SQU7_9ZZZZ